MKKRILSLLLAVITILQVIPVFTLPAIAEDTVDKSVVGSTVRFNTTNIVYLYSDVTYDGPSSKTSRVSPSNLPETLVVLDAITVSYGTEFYKLGTVDGSSHSILDEYPWVKAALMEAVPEPSDGLIRGEVGLVMDGKTVENLTIAEGEKTYVFTELSDKLDGDPSYRWELLIDRENNRWATVQDYVYPYATISEALIANAGSENGAATLRCIATLDGKNYVSGELDIAVDKNLPAPSVPEVPKADDTVQSQSTDSLNAPAAAKMVRSSNARAATEDAFQISVNYIYARVNESGSHENAYTPFTVSLSGGETFTGTVNSPFIIGYTACVLVEDGTGSITFEGKTYNEMPSWTFTSVGVNDTDKQKITIYYVPQKVNFIVEHYYQNLKDDGYSLAGMDSIKTKYADEAVGEGLAKNEYGYTPLFYDTTTTVSGNGNTVIEIYYDRVYYLVDFELDGGYGLMPYYVRFGTQVMLTTPTKPGYSFVNPWQLDRVYTVNEDTKVETDLDMDDVDISAAYKNKNANATITVQHNLEYTANWKEGSTSYTIAYWLEDPNYRDGVDPESQKYKIWGTQNITGATAGDIVDGPRAGDVPTAWTTYTGVVKSEGNRTRQINELNYLDFVSSDQDVEVKGNGSTVVNVYYDRKEYTLKFYYARSTGTGQNIKWYVAGQTDANTSFVKTSSNDELKCLDNNNGSFGQVDSEPTLKAGVAKEKGYTLGQDTSSIGTYYYLSFKAKYGADISDQYPCDIFNSVERTSNQYSNGWSDKTVLMSAWSGEYNVMFSRVDGNKTMKGKYQILDYRMLWDPSASGWNTNSNDNTVAYLAFWENAINQNWNVPELYRYKIWVQVLDGQDIGNKPTYTQTFNGKTVTYYLYDAYDTCDNSTVGEQTQPTMKGFTPSGSTSRNNIENRYNFNVNSWTNQPDLTRDEISEIRTLMDGQYKEAFIVNYFYTRDTAQLSFSNTYTAPEVFEIPYQQSIAGYATKVPAYPTSVEKGAMVFEGDFDNDGIGDGTGWYIDENCTIEFSFNINMDTDNIQLFSKWLPTEHTVKVYRQESEIDSDESGKLLLDKTVEFGTQIQEDELAEYEKPNENYIFGGWYYQDENGDENRYDFNTMVVKHAYVIYAKWIKNVPIPYTVRYVTMEGDETVEISKTESGVSLEGVTKTYTAKSGVDLNSPYNEWYFPTERYITFTMSANEADNVVEFKYETATSITYTISHVFKSEEFKNLFSDQRDTFIYNTEFTITKGTDAFQASIQEKFNDLVTEANIKAAAGNAGATDATKVWNIIKGLTPDYYQQELQLCLDAASNVMTFTWEDKGATTMYQVIHYTQNKDLKTYSVFSTEGYIVNATSTETFTADWLDMYGYTQNTIKSKVSGKLPTGDSLDGLVLELFYDRALYTYTVHHYVTGTTQKLADDESKQAYFEEEISVASVAKESINGYLLYNGDFTHTIGAADYEVACYYSPMKVNFRYQEAIAGRGSISRVTYEGFVGTPPDPDKASSTAIPNPGYTFAGWFLDASATQPVTNGIATISGTTITPLTPTPEMANQTITFYALFEPTSLTITSTVTAGENTPDWVIPGQGFIYTIEGKPDTATAGISLTVAVPVDEELTILGLPLGDYTITVEGDWSWRYGQQAGTSDFTMEKEGKTLNFTYTAPAPDVGQNGYYITDGSYNDPTPKSEP